MSFLTLKKNLHVFIQPLVDLISKSPSSGWEIHFACPQPTHRRAVSRFPSVGFSSSQLLDSSSALILWGRGSKVDNGQQSNFTAPASDRHRVILGGTLSILLSAYPQEHSELNQTLISPLLC